MLVEGPLLLELFWDDRAVLPESFFCISVIHLGCLHHLELLLAYDLVREAVELVIPDASCLQIKAQIVIGV